MAENQAVWGIEIGQAGLKAIKLRYAEAAGQVLAVAFDYIPHAKILSQPDAVPAELISQALQTFLSRNELKGDKVIISVPGQTALARFIQLPPVPSTKVPEIVKFEARQQIPFALEDVIWDYQILSVGSEEAEFMLDAEVGLFAMKRDQVMDQLNPFSTAKVEVDQIQIAPLGLYNVLYYDQMGMRITDEEQKKEDHFIILDMGADNTTLVVTNGSKIWIRNVPVGGNHFTRALTKEMKLTFAKAEHLKCNATKSPDPRAVFKALQPVFNDYVSEIQRSIGYFSSVNRNAKIKKLIGVGNGFKLAGLQKFLQQNLTQFEVERLSSYKGLVGDNVLNAALFEENLLSFAVPYGLALQALKLTKVRTNLLPPEIATARKIRAKKPWATVTAAALLLGVSISAVGYANVEKSVHTDRFGDAEKKVADFAGKVNNFKSGYTAKQGQHDAIIKEGRVLIDQLNARENWLEVYKAINECLPRDKPGVIVEDIELQHRVKLQSIIAEKKTDLSSEWYVNLTEDQVGSMLEEDRKPPTGEGYLFTIDGMHYHHDKTDPDYGQAASYVMHSLLKNFKQWNSSTGQPVRAIGITHPVLVKATTNPTRVLYSPDLREQQMLLQQRNMRDMGNMGNVGTAPQNNKSEPNAAPDGTKPEKDSKIKEIYQTRFVIQFVWQPVPKEEREVNDIIMSKVAPDHMTYEPYPPNPKAKRAEPNLDVPLSEIEVEVNKLNEQITAENEKQKELDPEDPNRQLQKELLKVTQEQYDKFKTRFLTKGTPETLPSALKASATPESGPPA
jgi:type IV pilus assembly protein PilM